MNFIFVASIKFIDYFNHMKPIDLAFLFFSVMLTTAAIAADVKFSKRDFGPLGETASITIDGEILSTDYYIVKQYLTGINENPNLRLNIILNSPGGSMSAGLRIAKLLQSLPLAVTSTVRNGDLPGICASACSIIYLGADYRFLPDESLIGLHQFSAISGSDLEVADGISISQVLSAEILKVVEKARVSNQFFYEMVSTKPNQINWLDAKKIKDFNLVNENIYLEESEFKVTEDGFPYLRLYQQSYHGKNKLVFACDENAPLVVSYVQPDDIDTFSHRYYDFKFVLNGLSLPPRKVFDKAKGDTWAETYFTLEDYQVEQLLSANTVGARHELKIGLFFGFEFKLNSNTRTMIANILEPCSSQKNQQETKTETDFNLIKNSDFRGGDFDKSGLRDVSLSQCVAVCKEIPSCKGISYVERKSWCWPKHTLNKSVVTSGVSSVIIRK